MQWRLPDAAGRRRGRLALALLMTLAGLGSGCDVINPALVGTLGGNTAVTMDRPEGHIVILLINTTPGRIAVTLTMTTDQGGTRTEGASLGPGYFPIVKDCELQSVTIEQFQYVAPGTGEVVEVPANLGTLIRGQAIQCGNVISITASGSPPEFLVQVY